MTQMGHDEMGWEVTERLSFLASLPLAGTGQREGGEKTQPFNRIQPRLGTVRMYTWHQCNVIDLIT